MEPEKNGFCFIPLPFKNDRQMLVLYDEQKQVVLGSSDNKKVSAYIHLFLL